ncbi:MAG TPA: hypothetical protein VGL75_09395 [Acidothermaceae bacterium]|jgi:hypothetical protein
MTTTEPTLEEAAKALLSAQGWHGPGDCDHEDCAPDFLTPDPEPLLGVVRETDVIGLARAFEQLHKLAHPDQPPHLSFCKAEPCRSLPWAVVNEIAKVA